MAFVRPPAALSKVHPIMTTSRPLAGLLALVVSTSLIASSAFALDLTDNQKQALGRLVKSNTAPYPTSPPPWRFEPLSSHRFWPSGRNTSRIKCVEFADRAGRASSWLAVWLFILWRRLAEW